MRAATLLLALLTPLQLGVVFPLEPDQLFTEDCAADPIPPWTDMSDTTAEAGHWQDSGGVCNAENAANDWVSMVQSATSYPNVYCSMLVSEADADNTRIGCVLRAASAGGDHLMAGFFNDANGWFLQNHDGDDSTNHGFVDQVDAVNDCGCTYTDIGSGDYIGMQLIETFATTAISWWDFGTSAPGLPSTWSTATCECDATEVAAATFTEINAAGACGPEARSADGLTGTEADIDTFACGDIP